MEQQSSNQSGISFDLTNEIAESLTVHKNVKQDIIITTSDKLKLVLIASKEAITSQRDWWTPAGILLAIIIVFCTADFKNSLGISKDVWHAIFIILGVLCFAWLLRCLYKLIKTWGDDNLDKIIAKIKPSNPSE